MKWVIAAILFLVLLFIASSAMAGPIRLEAESMLTSHDAGGIAIHVVSCSAASGKLAVDGLDTDGEWIQLALTLDVPYCFVDSVRSAGGPGVVRRFTVDFDPLPPGESASDTLTTVPGSGIT